MARVDDLYERQKRYYQLRAREYDVTAWPQTVEGVADVAGLMTALLSLPPARTVDVACGTGFLTRHLRGALTLLDASEEMLTIAASRLLEAKLVLAEAPPLPFRHAAFERVFSSQFYDHLRPLERRWFLAEACRVAPELVLVAQSRGPEHRENPEDRVLQDGSKHQVYAAYFSARSLLAELEGGELLFEGSFFLVARRRW